MLWILYSAPVCILFLLKMDHFLPISLKCCEVNKIEVQNKYKANEFMFSSCLILSTKSLFYLSLSNGYHCLSQKSIFIYTYKCFIF